MLEADVACCSCLKITSKLNFRRRRGRDTFQRYLQESALPNTEVLLLIFDSSLIRKERRSKVKPIALSRERSDDETFACNGVCQQFLGLTMGTTILLRHGYTTIGPRLSQKQVTNKSFHIAAFTAAHGFEN